MLRGLLIYNPMAGRYPSELLAERAANVLREFGWQIHLEKAQSPESITELAHQSAQEGYEAVFVVGGDGSLNLAVAGLVGTDTALGVLPAGTANVWAQELGLPGLTWTRWSALEDSAKKLARPQVFTTDVGWCSGHPFLLWAGAGLDAFIVHRIEPRGRLEKHFATVHYMASAVWNASFWHGMNLQALVDGHPISGHFLLAVMSNIHLYAGGLAQLSPDARVDDGVMDLWLFEGETLGDTVQVVWDLLAGRHTQSDHVTYYPFRQLELSSDSHLFVQLDGEPLDTDGPIQIEVQPQALKVLVPAHTPHTLFRHPPGRRWRGALHPAA
jgi:diacylglycerol kinase (ATP)